MANEVLGQGPATNPLVEVDLDRLRGEFRAAFKQGPRPEISDYLKDVSGNTKADLLRDLLEIELCRRFEQREAFTIDDYRGRFPRYEAIIEQVFDQCAKHRELKGYERLEFLGRGGMGVVYRARQIGLDRAVAIKFLADNCVNNERMIARFQQERQSIGQLNHENIVQAYDAGEDQGRQFLIMEFVDGVSLADLIRLRGPLPLMEACEIARQAADGLDYARKKAVVHRDIKPSNLMLAREGTVKILDFGLARVKLEHDGGRETRDGSAMGTLDYMAPEQFEDAKNVDHRADIYSLGCTMFHLLAGRAPFGIPKYSSDLAKKKGHTLDATPRIDDDDLRPDVPAEVAEVVSRMMAKHRTERFSTAAEVATALAPYAVGADLIGLGDPNKTRAEMPGSDSLRTVSRSKEKTARPSKTSRPTAASGESGVARLLADRLWRRPYIAAVAALIVVLLGLLPFMLPGAKESPQPGPVSPLPNLIRFDEAVATLPGLNGSWWFNETPWLIPLVRQRWLQESRPSEQAKAAAAKAAVTDRPAATELDRLLNGPNVDKFAQNLKENKIPTHSGITGTDQQHVNDICERVEFDNNQNRYRKNLVSARELVLKRLPPIDSSPLEVSWKEKNVSSADCHLFAILSHYLATMAPTDDSAPTANNELKAHTSDRTELWKQAEQAYLLAAKKYEDEGYLSLQALCYGDLAQMYADESNDQAAVSTFQTAIDRARDNSPSPFFLVYARLGKTSCQSRLTHFPAALQSIELARDDAKTLPKDHPLRASIYEQEGLVYIDKTDWINANKCFGMAKTMRENIGQQDNGPILLDVHCHALALQYQALFGDETDNVRRNHLVDSQKEFQNLLERLDDLLKQGPALTPRQRQDLIDRQIIASVRHADGYLYGTLGYAEAAQRYDGTISMIEAAGYPKDADLFYKRVIALACAGKIDGAKTAAHDAERIYHGMTATEQESLDFVRMVARNICLWQASEKTDATKNAIIDDVATVYSQLRNHEKKPLPPRDLPLLRNEKLQDRLLAAFVDNELHAKALEAARKRLAPSSEQPGTK